MIPPEPDTIAASLLPCSAACSDGQHSAKCPSPWRAIFAAVIRAERLGWNQAVKHRLTQLLDENCELRRQLNRLKSGEPVPEPQVRIEELEMDVREWKALALARSVQLGKLADELPPDLASVPSESLREPRRLAGSILGSLVRLVDGEPAHWEESAAGPKIREELVAWLWRWNLTDKRGVVDAELWAKAQRTLEDAP